METTAAHADDPVILLTDEVLDEPIGYDPRHLSADMLSLKLRMSAPGTTEQRALLGEQRRRWNADEGRRRRLGPALAVVMALLLPLGCTEAPRTFPPRTFGDCIGNGQSVETSYEAPDGATVVTVTSFACWCTAEYAAACPADCAGCDLGVSG